MDSASEAAHQQATVGKWAGKWEDQWMGSPRSAWVNTTHDWSTVMDHDHLSQIRIHPERYAPGGLVHLLLEVVAYADDEAESSGRPGICTITLYGDGSVSVADDGRGTDTRPAEDGRPIRKPVMSTKDLRFFDDPPTVHLPDATPRRGMSVVAALSDWLVHTNRRRNGAWTQRYENGVPVTDLVAVEGDGTTGTTVHFMPSRAVRRPERLTPARVHGVLAPFAHLEITVVAHD
jgi:topoisomerase-4 subunit B